RDGTGPENDLHLPDAPRNRAGSSRLVPEVRDGSGAETSRRSGRGRPRTALDDVAVLGFTGVDGSGVPAGNVADDGGRAAFRHFANPFHLAATRAQCTGDLVGRLAVLRPRHQVDRNDEL